MPISSHLLTVLVITFLTLGLSASDAYAGDNTLDQLNTAFTINNFNDLDDRAMQLQANLAQNYISNPANKAKIATPAGQQLIANQTKLLNFMAIKDAFAKCAATTKRNIAARIIDAAGQSQIVNVDCGMHLEGMANVAQYLNSIKAPMDVTAKDLLQREVYEQGMQDATKSYLDLKVKYSGAAVNANQALDLCSVQFGRGTKRNICDQQTQNSMLSTGQNYLTALRRARADNHYTPTQAAGALNADIAKLNRDLASMSNLQAHRRFLGNTADLTPDQQNQFSTSYLTDFLVSASSGPGLLMMTDHIRKAMGAARGKDDVDQINGRYVFKPHNAVSPLDVSEAVDEAEDAVRSQAADLVHMEYQRQIDNRSGTFGKGVNWAARDATRTSALKQLIQVNPTAVAQVLINHPEAAPLVCSLINQTTADDARNAKLKAAYTVGGLIVGGVLLVSGVGSAAGAGVLTWLLGEGAVAATATLATVGTITTIAGIGVGLTDVAYQSAQAIQARQDATNFEASFLSGTGDGQSFQDVDSALKDYNAARVQAVVSLGFSAVDLGTLSTVLKAGKVADEAARAAPRPTIASNILRSITKTISTIASNPKYASSLEKLRVLAGGDKVAKFVGYLSEVSDATRIKILQNLIKWSPEKFEKLLEKALLRAQQKGVTVEQAFAELADGVEHAGSGASAAREPGGHSAQAEQGSHPGGSHPESQNHPGGVRSAEPPESDEIPHDENGFRMRVEVEHERAILARQFDKVEISPEPEFGNITTEEHYQDTIRLVARANSLLKEPLNAEEQRIVHEVLTALHNDDGVKNFSDAWKQRLDLLSERPEAKSLLGKIDPALMKTTEHLYDEWGKGAVREEFLASIVQDAMVLAMRSGEHLDPARLASLISEGNNASRGGLESRYLEAVMINRLSGPGRTLDIVSGTVSSAKFNQSIGNVVWDLGAGDIHGALSHLVQKAFAEHILGRRGADSYFHAMQIPNNQVLWGAAFERPIGSIEGGLSVADINHVLAGLRDRHVGLIDYNP